MSLFDKARKLFARPVWGRMGGRQAEMGQAVDAAFAEAGMRQPVTDALGEAEQRDAVRTQVWLDSCPTTFITCADDCMDCQAEAVAFYEFEAARAHSEELKAFYSRARERAFNRLHPPRTDTATDLAAAMSAPASTPDLPEQVGAEERRRDDEVLAGAGDLAPVDHSPGGQAASEVAATIQAELAADQDEQEHTADQAHGGTGSPPSDRVDVTMSAASPSAAEESTAATSTADALRRAEAACERIADTLAAEQRHAAERERADQLSRWHQADRATSVDTSMNRGLF